MLKYEELPKLNSERWLSLEDLPDEIWKEVPNFEGLLLISNYARVINIPKRRIIKQSITKDNYLICFEIGSTQSTAIIDIANKYLTDVNISVEKDYAGLDRFIFITNVRK